MLQFGLRLAIEFSRRKFIARTQNIEAVQAQFLERLLRNYQDTQFGKDYGFHQMRSTADFRQKMPILTYASYEPYIDRIVKGEANVLLPDPVVYLTLTSGSTGRKKLVPTSRKSQNILRRANLTSLGFLKAGLERRGLKLGKILLTNSALTWGKTEAGTDFGPASVGVMRMDERLYKMLFANPIESLQVADRDARHYLALRFALVDPQMQGIVANFPMLILRICSYLDRYGEALVEDIDTGEIAPWLDIEPELRRVLSERVQANPKRAAELRQILQRDGRLTPKAIWKDNLFATAARGGTSDFYFRRFAEYFGNAPIFGGVFSSAEGTFSNPARILRF